MFKKLKDKLAEEVKSSPQKFQQFAQAAQAAVTSASSSISDITNSDLFSIGDNESQHGRSVKSSPSEQKSTFQDVSLNQPGSLQTSMDSMDYTSVHDLTQENQRQRRLSNSSFASDVSFRLPSYESPSMYHLQSDMEISASEAEERGFPGGNVSLDRVTKEQIYAAYKRMQERYTKYRTQYADLARHYKLLERENSKAKSVLVETQDKALRRISELREQCSLEQSAKAHLEKALRVEIEERNIKIDTLNTKIKILQNSDKDRDLSDKSTSENKSNEQLIHFDNENNVANEEPATTESTILSNKIEKLEILVNKYKDSLKTTKEKNAQLTTELQILSGELESKNKDIEQLKLNTQQLDETKQKISELNDRNEELQNKVNTFDFNKTKELSTLEMDLQKAQEEIAQLQGKIEVFTKREEEYAISLAENKLSIHKELESKETEIKSLKEFLSQSKQEVQSLNIVINDYKNSISALEDECSRLKKYVTDHDSMKNKIADLESQIQGLNQKCQVLETSKVKADEEYKCLQLQLTQETAEKLAMVDRNDYLENRNTQLSEDNANKTSQISKLNNEIQVLKRETNIVVTEDTTEKTKLVEEINLWKSKYSALESEIQEEREELVKLQSEIEKLLANHELIQIENSELNSQLTDLKTKYKLLSNQQSNLWQTMNTTSSKLLLQVKDLQNNVALTAQDIKNFKHESNNEINKTKNNITTYLTNLPIIDELKTSNENYKVECLSLQSELIQIKEKYEHISKDLHMSVEENKKLKSETDKYRSQKVDFHEKLENINKELLSLKNENQKLTENVGEYQKKCHELQKNIDDVNNEKTILKQDNASLIDKVKHFENTDKVSNLEIKEVKENQDRTLKQLNQLIEEKEQLMHKLKDSEEYQLRNEKLQQVVKQLTQENIFLKTQSEAISNNLKDLEIELMEVRKSHAEIDIEKDHLVATIEQLEKKQCEKDLVDKDIQTEQLVKETNPDSKIKCSAVETLSIDPETEDDAKSKADENNLLKEENKRLQSDVTGLQNYLAKISKENSELNDKIREMIASSENIPGKGELLNQNLSYLKTEIQSEKNRLDDLIRENTLLVEENLELKDQLNSHNYVNPTEPARGESKEMDYTSLKEKYKNILDINSRLEKRMLDLESMNKSVNGNMQQMQENNDKLKLSNEKLERRLDEALVSLRHLHSLQENTELEYLRNILYEYLTGTGAHSITLAKVLAAVVKFDDRQTQMILQKEKERQGLLRQLGLI